MLELEEIHNDNLVPKDSISYEIALKIPQDFINFRLDSSIKHILLDEFQDTSVVQYKILEPFFKQIDTLFEI
jgi:ATP-dependent exoDNAse (exonuclease V) beta subunit